MLIKPIIFLILALYPENVDLYALFAWFGERGFVGRGSSLALWAIMGMALYLRLRSAGHGH
jgi:hypothetical protein